MSSILYITINLVNHAMILYNKYIILLKLLSSIKFMARIPKPIILVVLDGWGLSHDHRNILTTTPLPTIKKMNAYYPLVALQASGISVGIPWGDAGNSEVGHMALGSGRIIYQNLPRISLAIQNESFFSNEAFRGAINHVKDNNSTLHIMGLLSSGAVHSHYDHMVALLELAKREGLSRVAIHPFLDGRDSAPNDGINMIERLMKDIERIGIGTIASLSGRHWAMDRNNNWDRIEKAYTAIIGTNPKHITNNMILETLQESYRSGTTDEFFEPSVIVDKTNTPVGNITDNDAVIFSNFREDRARQMTRALSEKECTKFARETRKNIYVATMTQYDKTLSRVHVAFPPQKIVNTLGEVLADYNKKQLRIAETEKYAHVTYFFNGGAEKPFSGEDHVLIPSPNVMRFDEAPEMSAQKITDRILEEMKKDFYDFILVNYANADMVGHTGNESASREAIRAIDTSLSRLIPATLARDGALFITADHGNIEELYNDKSGMMSTEHSANPVPLWYITKDNHRRTPRDENFMPKVAGLLSDVAPTILSVMQLKKPREMQGQDLLPLFRMQK